MGFTTPCFIRKNTPELRKKLEELGYEILNSGDTTLDAHNYDGKGSHKSIEEGKAIITSYGNLYGVIYDVDTVTKKGRIDCGTNEELFLAIATLRDDTDNNQWFVLDISIGSVNYPSSMISKGSFLKCMIDKWELYKSDIYPTGISAHKATVNELIKHFK
jgi:hypothetical protein